jgi:hypothetical protein
MWSFIAPLSRRARWLAFMAACILILTVLTIQIRRRRAQPVLPYHDSFARHSAREWIPLGGSWRVQDSAVINWSDAQGSKLITGSQRWSDYQVTSDLRLLAHGGDVGLIVRVSERKSALTPTKATTSACGRATLPS